MKKYVFAIFLCILSIIPRVGVAETQKTLRLEDFLNDVKQSKVLQIVIEQTMASYTHANAYLQVNGRDKIYCLETISLNYQNFEQIMEFFIRNHPKMKDFEVKGDTWRAVLLFALVERFPCK